MKAFLAHLKVIAAIIWRVFRYGARVAVEWALNKLLVKQQTRPVSGARPGATRAASMPSFRKGIVKTEQIRTLEVMSPEIKILYTQLLALQVLADHQIDSREFSDLYVFMVQIGLDVAARAQVRTTLIRSDLSPLELADELLSGVSADEQPLIKFSMVKDLLHVSRMDGHVSDEETDLIRQLAAHLYPEPGRAENILRFADKAIDYDEKLLMGRLTADEFTRGAKDLAATATSIGVPITAVYFSGSVIGLSAAGIISGLTELGLGGILGLSSLVTGIGVVVVMGVITFKLVNWAVTGKDRRMEKIREHMIQEVITLNQQAMLALGEDINALSSRMEHLAGVSEQNRQMLTQLQALYQNALMVLRQRKERYGESENTR